MRRFFKIPLIPEPTVGFVACLRKMEECYLCNRTSSQRWYPSPHSTGLFHCNACHVIKNSKACPYCGIEGSQSSADAVFICIICFRDTHHKCTAEFRGRTRKRYVLFVRLSIESAYANTTEKSSLYKSKTFHHCSIIIFISFLDIFEGLFTYPPNLLKKISKG